MNPYLALVSFNLWILEARDDGRRLAQISNRFADFASFRCVTGSVGSKRRPGILR
jgi:hypothetical protein